MMSLRFSFPCILVLCIFFASCHDDIIDDSMIDNFGEYACQFEQNDGDEDGLIDEEERGLMEECTSQSLKSISSIEDNLIGEWELIGHGEGWVPTVSQPCGYLIFTKDVLRYTFRSAYTDTVMSVSWEIEEINSPNFNFSLKTKPQTSEGISVLNIFCEDYMFGNATPVDGNMYLYKKVK